jgi:hypothetical protein
VRGPSRFLRTQQRQAQDHSVSLRWAPTGDPPGMISPIPPKPRPRHCYDHRLREHVMRSGPTSRGRRLAIPRSTIWCPPQQHRPRTKSATSTRDALRFRCRRWPCPSPAARPDGRFPVRGHAIAGIAANACHPAVSRPARPPPEPARYPPLRHPQLRRARPREPRPPPAAGKPSPFIATASVLRQNSSHAWEHAGERW